MAEIARVGVALGGKAVTFYGLTGMGDLIVTCTSMHSRNRRAGILIGEGKTLDEAVKEAYEFAIENGITYTQSLGFMAGEMKAATLKLMMRGVKAKPTLALGRTKEQAQMLYDESCKSLGEGESKKRYVPRALNIILKKEKFSFDMVIEALRTIPSSEVTMARLADCGEKEACIAGALISWILTLQRQKETKTAA